MRLAIAIALAACSGSTTKPTEVERAPATQPSGAPQTAPVQPATEPPPKQMQLPSVSVDGTLPAKSWSFVAVEADGRVRVGAVPASALGDDGVELAQLTKGTEVPPEEVGRAGRTIVAERAAQEPPPPAPPPKPTPKRSKKKKLTPREQAIEQARAAGILGDDTQYPSCGDPLQGLTAGGPRPKEMAPVHATACPLESPDKTASYAHLLLADRNTPAAVVLEPFVGDNGTALVRLGVTVDGTHARTLPVQLGQNTRMGPAAPRPALERILVFDKVADPAALAQRVRSGGAWIWILRDVSYQRLVELVHALAIAGVAPITITLEDPR